MEDRALKLETISFEDLVKEVEARYGRGWRIVKLRRCLGCDQPLSGRDIRSHKCKVGWRKRITGGFSDRRKRSERCGHGDQWKLCAECGGRVHKADCTGVRDPQLDCCEERHALVGAA